MDRTGPITFAVFARYPRLGKVKSRLAAGIGSEAALRIYEAMLSDSLLRYRRLPKITATIYFTGCSAAEAEAFISCRGGVAGYGMALQGEGDLGERMQAACDRALDNSAAMVFVGSDSPTVPLAYLRRAIRELEDGVPVVLGPSHDGGYYLLGLTRPRPELFREIAWGTDSVLAQTMARLSPEESVLLPRWYDVDDSEDLSLLRRDLERRPSFEDRNLRAALFG